MCLTLHKAAPRECSTTQRMRRRREIGIQRRGALKPKWCFNLFSITHWGTFKAENETNVNEHTCVMRILIRPPMARAANHNLDVASANRTPKMSRRDLPRSRKEEEKKQLVHNSSTSNFRQQWKHNKRVWLQGRWLCDDVLCCVTSPAWAFIRPSKWEEHGCNNLTARHN